MNTVCLMGNICQDLELRTVKVKKEKTSVVEFTVAVKRYEDVTDFIRVTAWGKTAEFIVKYFKKGSKIAVTGEINTGSYEDDEGKTRYTWTVRVSSVEFCEKAKDSGKKKKKKDDDEDDE